MKFLKNASLPKKPTVYMITGFLCLLTMVIMITLVNAEEDRVQVKEEETLPLVEVQEVAAQDLKEVFHTMGFFVPENDWRITPKTLGTVEEIHVQEGDQVKQGDLLFRLDSSKQESAIMEAESGLASARGNLAQSRQEDTWSLTMATEHFEEAKAHEQEQKEALKEAREAYEVGELKAYELTKYEKRVELAERKRESAEDLVESIEGGDRTKVQESFYEEQIKWSKRILERAKEEYEKTYITAPTDGEVLKVRITEGDMANPVTPSVVLAGEGKMQLSTGISEQYLMRISEGDLAEVVIPAISDEKREAQVTEVGMIPEEGGRFYPVKLVVSEEIEAQRIGMSAEIELATARAKEVLAVPRYALYSEGEEEFVYVVDEEQKLKQKSVTPGISEKGMVQVDGLKEGAQVVVAGPSDLKEGMEVEVAKEGEEE